MSGSGKGRWGSFLQQAVAAAESRLDNILAEGEEGATPNKAAVAAPTISATKAEEGISRSASSSSNKPDRLQERLAKAIAAKNQAQRARATSGASTNAAPSRTQSPVQNIESPRQSLDVSIGAGDSSPGPRSPQSDTTKEGTAGRNSRSSDDPAQLDVDQSKSHTPRSSINSIVEVADNQKPLTERSATPDVEAAPRFSTESNGSNVPKISIDSPNSEVPAPRRSADASSTRLSGNAPSTSRSPEEFEILLSQLQSDFETSELQKQEEIHGYIERIDALQSKLQYLSKESAESARRASISAPAGSLEKKLAEKEEQVALLMEEGQKLSKTEMKYLTTIKKLRAKQTEDSKEIADARKQQEKAEKELAILSERLQRAEASERRSNDKSKLAVQLQREVDSLKIERDSKDSIIADLRAQLESNILQEMQAETYAVQQSLEAERKRVAELEDRMSDLNLEKSLVADRAQTQIKEMKDKMAMEAERSRVAALEAQTEQQTLESKLEIMRARAEEVSSGATGDAQAKLLRQIETLQTQYAVASENWQGIEASLIARAASLEKEKDEATRREADIRKKAREVTLKAKRHEEELEDARSQLPTVQQEAASQKAQIDELRRRSEVAESALAEAKVSFEKEKESLKVEMQQRIDEESQKFHEDNSGPGSFAQSRAESPGTSTRRGLTTEFLGLQNIQMRRAAARSVNNDVPSERFLGRRPSAVAPPRSSGRATPSRQDSNLSLRTNGDVLDAPSIHTIDHDEFFERTESPTSQHHTINDMISVSTAAAGPSVQLVERMSSAVRRLESEKAATKEELARLSAQRDEARAEIVALMREVDSKRAADNKIAELEAEIKDINSRYQTTLEMLGEKSELVEELQSDIIDLKAMYRELVERTVK